jgi:deoxycytidine triphosphate deaminase
MTTLSDQSIKERLIPEKDAAKAKEWFKKREWKNIGDRFLISPFDQDMVGPSSYDLSIGDEAKLLRTGEEINVREKKKLRIDPGDTVLILTQEYVGLSRNISGVIEPRARLLFDGLVVTATKVDPTWYGKLAIAIRNNSSNARELNYGESFCTLILNELDKQAVKILTKDRVSFLGQESLMSGPTHATPWIPKRPESVNVEDLDKIVDEFGPPFDVIRGIYPLLKEDTRRFIEREWGPHVLREYEHVATAKAFSYLKWLTSALIIALILLVIHLLVN